MSFKLFYYIKRFGYNALPQSFFDRNYKRLMEFEQQCDPAELEARINYYIKIKGGKHCGHIEKQINNTSGL